LVQSIRFSEKVFPNVQALATIQFLDMVGDIKLSGFARLKLLACIFQTFLIVPGAVVKNFKLIYIPRHKVQLAFT
jgi:hypothetical protein